MTHLCTLDYAERAIENERRYRAGQRQVYCPACRLWRWPDECGHGGRLSEARFKAWAKRLPQGGTA